MVARPALRGMSARIFKPELSEGNAFGCWSSSDASAKRPAIKRATANNKAASSMKESSRFAGRNAARPCCTLRAELRISLARTENRCTLSSSLARIASPSLAVGIEGDLRSLVR